MSARILNVPFALAVLLVLTASPLRSQTPVTQGPPPDSLTQEVLEYLNDPDVLRFSGSTRIPPGSRIEGDVAVLAGSLQLGGVIEGRLLVVNGDLDLLPGARVTGETLVVGGVVTGEEGASLEGPIQIYAGPLRYRIRAGRVEGLPEPGIAPGFLSSDLGIGQARFTLRAGEGYNRIEGLPVRFGPLIQTAGSNPLRLEAFGIWRSVSGLSLKSDRLGYAFRLEQALGGRGVTSLGASAHSEVIAVEGRGVSDLESSLSTFFLRRDLRDYYDREGWSVFARFLPARTPIQAQVTYREEEHLTPPLRNPWTLRDGDIPWRPLALVAEGRIRSVEANVLWDSRDDPDHPSSGWWIDVGLRRQVGGELRLPPSAPEGAGPVDPDLEETGPLPFFSQGTVDLRHYARVGPTSRLNLRAVASGSLDGTQLPPQFQTALGGEGGLPGHPRFSVDCGARAEVRWARTGEPSEDRPIQAVYPTYGCDRTVLFQAEYLGAFPISWNPFPDEWEDSELSQLLDLQPVWSIFLNAGRGWSRGTLETGGVRTQSPTRADIGLGFFLGSIGLYWSYPLNRRDQGVNFSVRLQERF